MVKKIGGVCLFIIAAVLLYINAGALIGYPEQKQMITYSVWIDNGIYDPQNEGKLVAMAPELYYQTDTYDKDLDIYIKTPAVTRHVEKLVRVPDSAEGEWEWKWMPVSDTDENFIHSKTFSGKNGNDILTVDPSLEVMLTAGKGITLKDIDPESLEKLDTITVYEGEHTYFTDAPHAVKYSSVKARSENSPFFNEEGGIRVWYQKAYDRSKTIVIIGTQKDQTITKCDKLSKSIFEDVTSKEEVLKKEKNYIIGGTVMFLLGVIILVYLGLRLTGVLKKGIFHSNKNNKMKPLA